jgi:AraC-like DNA-binding protein
VAVVGPRLTALRVPVRREVRYIGVRTTPGGSPALGVSPRALRERVALLHEVAPLRARTLVAALAGTTTPGALLDALARVVGDWVCASPPPDRVVSTMVERILRARGQDAVGSVAAGTGLSYRQGVRRFVEAVGLSPKELARLARLRHACLQALALEKPSWADVSAATGFADQSHMAREFSHVFGWPPSLVREYLRRIEHIHVPA